MTQVDPPARDTVTTAKENAAFRVARVAAGCNTPPELARRLQEFAGQHGFGRGPDSRTVLRWEKGERYPDRGNRQLLLQFFGVASLSELGFRSAEEGEPAHHANETDRRARVVPLRRAQASRPATTSVEYHVITVAYRQLYQVVDPEQLHPPVAEHVHFGESLLDETHGDARHDLAVSLAEAGLLAGRIEFFDLGQPAAAEENYRRAMTAAADADHRLLGAATLGHLAFIPGWAGERGLSLERIRGAREYARRADPAPPGAFLAWLDAVEAECETYCGQPRRALTLINSAEDQLAADPNTRSAMFRPHQNIDPHSNAGADAGTDAAASTRLSEWPDWFNWFSPGQLASFRGGVELHLGHLLQARTALTTALEHFEHSGSTKQQAVILADLAAVAAAQDRPADASSYLLTALDLLETTAYRTALDRVRAVRGQLDPWRNTAEVRAVDDRLYGWQATLSGLR